MHKISLSHIRTNEPYQTEFMPPTWLCQNDFIPIDWKWMNALHLKNTDGENEDETKKEKEVQIVEP